MPPQIVYNTTGATAGTTILFGQPARVQDTDFEGIGNEIVTDGGTVVYTHKYMDRKITVEFQAETAGAKNAFYTFFQTAGCKGGSFLFWPTAAEAGTYHTVTLAERTYQPRPFQDMHALGLWDWTMVVRKVN